MQWCERVAHAATRWEWRSHALVLALVVAAFALPIVFIVSSWLGGDYGSPRWASVIYGTLGYWLAVRPALRSLRRWDENHAAPADVP